MNKNMKHTINRFKQELKSLSFKEKKDLLSDLKAEYMVSRNVLRKEQPGKYHRNPKLLRRLIAIVKTDLNVKGWRYNPR